MAANQKIDPVDLIPSLKEAVANFKVQMDPWYYSVGLAAVDNRPAVAEPVNEIPIFGGEDHALWTSPKLSELFRGEVQPPDLNREPEKYTTYFSFIEKHACHYCLNFNPPTDQEMESYYSNLARRPDGKTTEPMHALLWQAAALLLAIYPLSRAEFEAIFRRLAQSCSNFAARPVSRNYAKHIKTMFAPA